MPDFMFNEGVLTLPPGWEDKSVTAITFPAGSPIPAATLTITRETLKDPQQPLTSYVGEQLTNLAKTCPGFQLIRHAPSQISNFSAELAEFTWTAPEQILVRQVVVVTLLQPQALVFTATATVDRFPEFEPIFYSVINSFRLRVS